MNIFLRMRAICFCAAVLVPSALLAQASMITCPVPGDGTYGTDLLQPGRLVGAGISPYDDGTYHVADYSAVFASGIRFPDNPNTYTEMWINTNGNITFNGRNLTYTPEYIPLPPTSVYPIIAPWYADVDFENAPAAAGFWYCEDTVNDQLIVTWEVSGFYQQNNNLMNTFQAIITDLGAACGAGESGVDIEFRYNDLQWYVGDFSNGAAGVDGSGVCPDPFVPPWETGGGDCFPAVVGFDVSGSTAHATTVTQSGYPGVLDLVTDSNVGEPGVTRWRLATSCGDGTQDACEQCDDGNSSNNDDCTTSCMDNVCGDNHANTQNGAELCDGTDLPAYASNRCEVIDATLYSGGYMVCNSSCDNYDDSSCVHLPRTCYSDQDGDGVTGTTQTVRMVDACADFDTDGRVWSDTDGGDCDEADASTYPGAAQNDSATDCMTDADGDDYGDATAAAPVTAGSDCDDNSATTYPGAASNDSGSDCMSDGDGDGYGDATAVGLVVAGSDCDDSSAVTFPGAASNDSATDCMRDADGDGYGDQSALAPVAAGSDCNDDVATGASVYPGASEIPADGIDQDCDSTDLCFLDGDNDGYRPDALATTASLDLDCDDSGEANASDPVGDCQDGDAAIYPGAIEGVADSVDQNCDGAELCYADADDDGYRPDAVSTVVSVNLACTDSGEAEAGDPTGDCQDSIAAINPGALELAGDEVDQNCDGVELCFADADDDGYRPDAISTVASVDTDCGDSGEALAGDATGDCSDGDGSINPGASEIPADGVDQNCDSSELCFADADDDGYRPDAIATTVSADLDCDDAAEATALDPIDDCRDDAATINPGATEIAGDSVDQNCDGSETCYVDGDDDGYRVDATSTVVSLDEDCGDSGEAGDGAPLGDCQDGNAAVNPGATELPADGVDQNCDNAELCFVDADDDGYRPDLVSTVFSPDMDCDDAGEASTGDPTGDCREDDGSINPGATELAGDEVDQNCDGQELCFADADDDGFRPDDTAVVVSVDLSCADAGEALATDPTGDCDDDPGQCGAACFPGNTAADVCDGADQNCDGDLDADPELVWYHDADGDGFVNPADTQYACLDPDGLATGWVTAVTAADCDDDPMACGAACFPGNTESCDGLDNDCAAGSDDIFPDADSDGIGDDCDTDDDNDGIPDSVEIGDDPLNPRNSDDDATPDYLDEDSDNDGIPDSLEAGADPTQPRDTDEDGLPDYRDADSDDDGIPDEIEVGSDPLDPVDTDNDLIPDYLDPDSDDDGLDDIDEVGDDPQNPRDSDGNNIPDYLEQDSDKDGYRDGDDNCPTMANPDQIDNDNDGLGAVCDPDDNSAGDAGFSDASGVEDAAGVDGGSGPDTGDSSDAGDSTDAGDNTDASSGEEGGTAGDGGRFEDAAARTDGGAGGDRDGQDAAAEDGGGQVEGGLLGDAVVVDDANVADVLAADASTADDIGAATDTSVNGDASAGDAVGLDLFSSAADARVSTKPDQDANTSLAGGGCSCSGHRSGGLATVLFALTLVAVWRRRWS